MAIKLSVPAQSRDESRSAPASLPDFCNIRVVFIIVVIAELLAIILALGYSGGAAARWTALGLLSLFIQLVALSCAALLCHGRRHIGRFGDTGAGFAAYLLIIMVTGLLSEIASFATRGAGLELALSRQSHADFLLYNLGVAAIVGAVILRYFYVQAQMRRTVEAESRARFQALQARIRPHFMFNSMNTIASLTRSDPALAEEVVEDLSELFRSALSDAYRPSTLADELDLARRYLRIESLRLGARLRVEERCRDLPGDARVPSLLIQPLVENAVYHGIEPLVDGGTIAIEGSFENGMIAIVVTNPCPPASAPAARREGHHMALENTRERLHLHYHGKGRLDAGQDAGVFRVSLVFPYQRGEP